MAKLSTFYFFISWYFFFSLYNFYFSSLTSFVNVFLSIFKRLTSVLSSSLTSYNLAELLPDLNFEILTLFFRYWNIHHIYRIFTRMFMFMLTLTSSNRCIKILFFIFSYWYIKVLFSSLFKLREIFFGTWSTHILLLLL